MSCRRFVWAAVAAGFCGCSDTPPEAGPADAGVDARLAPAIGTGDHSPASVTFTKLADDDDDVQEPRDLDFNPRVEGELWVVNFEDDSVVIIHDATGDDPEPEYKKDWYGYFTGEPASHFMAEPTAIAFGADETTFGTPGTFATCGESRNTYDDFAPPNDFMGAALWSSDLDVFANRPNLVLGSHLDMLHCGPLCMGLSHQEDNEYWAFTGRARDPESPFNQNAFLQEAAIVHYNFNEDDGIGNDNHSDGEAYQYVTGEVDYVSGVPSHLVYDEKTELLYIADTGNSRIAALDTDSGDADVQLVPHEPMFDYRVMDDAEITDVVPDGGVLDQPSGLALWNGHLYVSDHATGVIHAFDLEGTRVNYLDTGRGKDALAGIVMGPDERLYFVDMSYDEVLRIDVPPTP